MLEKPHSRSVAERTFLTPAPTKQAFKRMRSALPDVRNWKRLSGAPNTFELYQGSEPSTHVRAYVGDFIRIAAPGPFPAQWVQVTKITFRHHSAELVVRPSYDPTEKEIRKHVTCHIFRSKATNTFVLSRNRQRSTSRSQDAMNSRIPSRQNVAEARGLISSLRSAYGLAFRKSFGIRLSRA